MAYDVALEVPPFRVIGTVFLFPGLRARATPGPGDRDVRAGRGRGGLLRASQRSTGPRSTSWSTASTCGGVEQIDRRTGAGAPDGCPATSQDSAARAGRPGAGSGSGGFLGPAEQRGTAGPWTRSARARLPASIPSRRSARASKSSVTFSRGNISMTVRPSFAARTKSRPPERMRAIAGIPTVRSMSATDTPLLARLTTSPSSSRTPSSTARSRSWTAGPQGGHVGRDRHEDPVGPLEDRPVERRVRRVQVDDDEVEAASRDVDRVGDAARLEDLGVERRVVRTDDLACPLGWCVASSGQRPDGRPSASVASSCRRRSGPGRGRASWRRGRSPCRRRRAGRAGRAGPGGSRRGSSRSSSCRRRPSG